MDPCGSCVPRRANGENESLHWPLTFHQPPVLLQLMMLYQLQDVLILGMAGRKSPGGFTPWGNRGQTRKSPGKPSPRGKVEIDLFKPQRTSWVASPRGHHSRMNPVTQLHKTEMSGDLCQRESTPTRGEVKT